MAGNAPRKGELEEQFAEPRFVLTDIRIDFAVDALQVGIGDHRRAAVAWSGDVDHVEIEVLDHAIQMRVDEVLAGRGAPMP